MKEEARMMKIITSVFRRDATWLQISMLNYSKKDGKSNINMTLVKDSK